MKDTEFYAALLRLSHPWSVREVKLNLAAERVDVWVQEDPATKWACPECGKTVPLYDHAEERTWRHLDTCEFQTFLHARLPRVNCPEHGVRKVLPTWASPGSQFTLRLECRVIDTLKECDVTGTTRLTGLSWDEAWGVLDRAVARGRSRKERRIPEYLSIDEKAFAKRHRYETLVCDLRRGTVEYVTDDKSQESLERYYSQFTAEELAQVKAVAMDMCDSYIAATRAFIPEAADKIVFDKFHVIRTVTDAVDKIRRQEHKLLTAEGDDRLKDTKHWWLANEENVPEYFRPAFEAVKASELKTSRAWAIKESLRHFWDYHYPQRAFNYFRRWYFWATHSKLPHMIEAARTLNRHLTNIMTYFRHRITNATAEGLNNKIQMVKEIACGFRNREHYKTAIYFHCGGLDLYPRLEASS